MDWITILNMVLLVLVIIALWYFQDAVLKYAQVQQKINRAQIAINEGVFKELVDLKKQIKEKNNE
jgi:cell division protein FtsB